MYLFTVFHVFVDIIFVCMCVCMYVHICALGEDLHDSDLSFTQVKLWTVGLQINISYANHFIDLISGLQNLHQLQVILYSSALI